MDDFLIKPRREGRDPLLNDYGLLLVNPAEAVAAQKKAVKQGWLRHFLFNSQLYTDPDGIGFWAGPAVGAPMAVMALEKLIALGARKILVYGWCGAIMPGVHIGELVMPTWCLSEEGTSAHYRRRAVTPETSAGLADRWAAEFIKAGFACRRGPVWTTDAPYMETKAKVRQCQEQGILGVDMELAALCTVAAVRGIELAAVFLVSDELWHDQWKSGFSSKAFKAESRALLEFVFDNCRVMAG
ncbi:MAG: nucleoside phosphorylase [Desulfobulbaceae bacterium]|nr:nucleoside phosphorylase [Desulfobulbaceae bacterium]HIJ79247.1 nucleoside phosphorylase [Deltaproteobacteria bacterium]